MIMKKIDDIDQEIINLLKRDARISSIKMAKILGICAPTIRRRVNKLIKNGVIRIQAMQLNRVRTLITVVIMLKIENNTVNQTVSLLASHPEVEFITMTTGQYNIAMRCWFKTIEAYSRFLNTVLYPLENVVEREILICTKNIKHAFVKLPDDSESIKTTIKKVDDLDMKIISALEEDAYKKFTELAKNLNVSVPTVRSRVNSLLRGNIIRIQAVPSSRIEKMVSALITLKVENNVINRIANYLAGMDETRWVVLYSGNYDIGVLAVFDTVEACYGFLNNVINPMEGVVKKMIDIQLEIKKWAHKW